VSDNTPVRLDTPTFVHRMSPIPLFGRSCFLIPFWFGYDHYFYLLFPGIRVSGVPSSLFLNFLCAVLDEHTSFRDRLLFWSPAWLDNSAVFQGFLDYRPLYLFFLVRVCGIGGVISPYFSK